MGEYIAYKVSKQADSVYGCQDSEFSIFFNLYFRGRENSFVMLTGHLRKTMVDYMSPWLEWIVL